MNAGELCNREVVYVYRETPLLEAAGLMREHHVGTLVVVVDRLSERVPVGILTDRDIVVAVVAKKLEPHLLTVGDIMSPDLFTVTEQTGIADVMHLMRTKGVRRVPVVTHSGALAGILSIDDLLAFFSEQLGDAAQVIERERVREARLRT